MTFVTTRNGGPVDLTTAMLQGLADDGGLFVPAELPRFAGGPPQDRVAVWAAIALFPTVSPETVERVVEAAIDFPIPLIEVTPGRFVLELFHGPTCAFKDVGARFMAGLMEELVGDDTRLRTVLVATSGDTGGAVADAFHGRTGARVAVLFPESGVSEVQRKQMTTLGGNVQALAVDGSFDDCQALVKGAFARSEARQRYGLTSANSINVARLLPQSIYYVLAAAALAGENGGWPRAAPRFVVPSGNLGNLCAGLFAARAGMPTAGFTAATNANRGFVDFLEGADFTPQPSVRTISNAMDVGAPSNLERIRWMYRGDDRALRAEIRGAWVTDEVAAECIRRTWEESGYLLDPHGAVAFEASKRHHASRDAPVVVLATAHPGKFPDVVAQAIGRDVRSPAQLDFATHKTEYMTRIEPTTEALFDALDRGRA